MAESGLSAGNRKEMRSSLRKGTYLVILIVSARTC